MLNDKCSMFQLPKLLLASASPRRAEILGFVGWEFEKQTADVDEKLISGEKPADYVRRLAEEKAVTVAGKNKNALVLGADTIVVVEETIIGKPKDFDEAREMLQTLSGRWHEVLTGVALVQNKEIRVDFQQTRVKFAELSEAEIEFLVEKGEPLDKAGAYAMQAQAALFIEKIEGDYWNVVGLPINLIYQMVKGFSSNQNKKG
jgi:septum formation protein